jgi:hypothetical protein
MSYQLLVGRATVPAKRKAVELAEFDADLNTVGLITKQGRKKPGYEGFKGLKSQLR